MDNLSLFLITNENELIEPILAAIKSQREERKLGILF